MRRFSCPLCGKSFTTKTSELEHLKKEHTNKLSLESINYLYSLGVDKKKIREFCKSNNLEFENLNQTLLDYAEM